MRVLIVRPKIEAGGAGKVIIQFAKGFNERGIEVYIATSGGEWLPKLAGIAQFLSLPLFPSTPSNLIRSSLQLQKIIRSHKIDIVNPHHRFATMACNLQALFNSAPVISTVHEVKEDRLFLSQFAFAKYAIVFSQAVKDNLVAVHGIQPDNVFPNPMGIEVAQPDTQQLLAVRKAFHLSNTVPVIACVTRLSEEKGCFIYLQSIAKVIRTGRQAQFLLVGDGPLRYELEQFALDLGIEKHLIFTGWRDDVPAIISNVDFLILPSLTEGVGITIIEGMALGKATIASRVGGIPEIIEDGVTGILVSPDDADSLALAITNALKDLDKMQKLGQSARQYYKNNLLADYMVDNVIHVFETIK